MLPRAELDPRTEEYKHDSARHSSLCKDLPHPRIWCNSCPRVWYTDSGSPRDRTGNQDRIAQRVRKTSAQVLLAWAVQRGTAFLTTSVTPARIQENFELSTLSEDSMQEIRDEVATRLRFNIVVETGVPGFIPRGR